MRTLALVRRAVDLALVPAGVALGETTVLTVAPDDGNTRALLAAARRAGATRCIRLWDAALESADYLGLAYALAAGVRAALPDLASKPTLLLAGDRGRGAVGPALAERLGLALLGQTLAVAHVDGTLQATRRGRGQLRRFAAPPPALVCLLVDELEPVHVDPNGPATDSESWPLAKVGMSAAELAYRRRFAPRPAPELGLTSAPLELPDAAALVARLRADGLVRDQGSG